MRQHAHIMLSTHPERWSDDPQLWASQWAKDFAGVRDVLFKEAF